jgi:hypothetical protein
MDDGGKKLEGVFLNIHEYLKKKHHVCIVAHTKQQLGLSLNGPAYGEKLRTYRNKVC